MGMGGFVEIGIDEIQPVFIIEVCLLFLLLIVS